MPAERNRALMHQVIEDIWNSGDLELADVLFAPTYVNHFGVIPDLVQGPEAIKISVALYRAAFPQLHVCVEEIVADGGTIVLRWTASDGSPHQDARGKRSASVTGTTLSHVAGKQIVESWTHWSPKSELPRLDLLRAAESMRKRTSVHR